MGADALEAVVGTALRAGIAIVRPGANCAPGDLVRGVGRGPKEGSRRALFPLRGFQQRVVEARGRADRCLAVRRTAYKAQVRRGFAVVLGRGLPGAGLDGGRSRPCRKRASREGARAAGRLLSDGAGAAARVIGAVRGAQVLEQIV